MFGKHNFEALTFSDLVAFQEANIDTSLIVRINVQSYRGSQIYSWVDILETKHPYITEVYYFGPDNALMKSHGLIVYEESDSRRAILEEYQLAQNYPNPFNAGTVITYKLPRSVPVTLEIYNVMGQKVRNLVDEQQPLG